MTKQQLDRRLRILELERENFIKRREAMIAGRRAMLKQRQISDMGHIASTYMAIVSAPIFLL